MLYEVRSMSGALMAVFSSSGIGAAVQSIAAAFGRCQIDVDRIVRTADEAKLPGEAVTAANRLGEWINPSLLPEGGA